MDKTVSNPIGLTREMLGIDQAVVAGRNKQRSIEDVKQYIASELDAEYQRGYQDGLQHLSHPAEKARHNIIKCCLEDIMNTIDATPEENSHKAKRDGLYLEKEESPSAKITDEVHDLIQYIYGNSDLTMKQLSELFGISKSRVHQIIHDRGWTDIGEWTDSKGKKHKNADSPRYKALGNSIALPFWEWMAKRIAKQYDRPAYMASLFDGIGGFPLVFQRAGIKPVWASEIEEFPIAVTKIHFPEVEE